MTSARVISVNPSKKTLGRFWEEGIPYRDKGLKLVRSVAKVPEVKLPMSFLFGIRKKRSTAYAMSTLAIRIVLGAAMIVFGVMNLDPANPAIVPLVMMFAGTMIFFGFMTRIVTFATAGYLGYMAVTSFLAGAPIDAMMIGTASTVGACLLIFILGPGRVSVDQLIRRAILVSKRRKRSRKSEARMTYKAFQNA